MPTRSKAVVTPQMPWAVDVGVVRALSRVNRTLTAAGCGRQPGAAMSMHRRADSSVCAFGERQTAPTRTVLGNPLFQVHRYRRRDVDFAHGAVPLLLLSSSLVWL